MNKSRYIQFLIGSMAVFFFQGCYSATLEISWKWHKPATELYDPAFHPSSDEIAIVTKAHWPDGHGAESYPENYFSNLEKRKEEDPRFADPTIVILENRGGSERKIDWGWDPAYSHDGRLLAYTFQKNPLTGFRVLAKTMEGNKIRISNGTKQGEDAVVPGFGYLTRPRFNSDGSMLAFSQNDAVNGAYGGKVGWGEVPVQFDDFPISAPDLKEFDGRYKEIQSFFQNPPDPEKDLKKFLAQSKRIPELLDDLPKEPSVTYKVPNRDHQLFLTSKGGKVVLEGKDGVQKGQLSVIGSIRELVWSPDSTRFAMIVSVGNEKLNDVFDHDELYIVNIRG